MRTTTRKVILAGLLCLATVAAAAPASAGPAPAVAPAAVAQAAAPWCGLTWGSGAKSGGALRTPELVKITTSAFDCWDRVTFEFAGPVDGYSVAYATVIPSEGEGRDLAPYVAGGAKLAVSLRAPAYTYPAVQGAHPVSVVRRQTLRDVLFAGSYEGYTQAAVGVRATLPYRVFVAAGPGTHSRIIVDVAHFW
jgi:hypothetical protein